ncbi:right-handed parallel beta-helix repeat-containing protein [Methylocystis heyeri]|uniref:right-handed parallel beta-helix repeat-containing protein n=1 Tax=Methylocystis heyeri TaxID=391905 RepID=UPI001AEDE8D5|nr:right-handed parallel beta-helix repeat-containing protein [Methylocystis heyeri]
MLLGARLLPSVAYDGRPLGPQGGAPPSGDVRLITFDDALTALSAGEQAASSGAPPGSSRRGIILYQGEERLTPARWPKSGFAVMSGLLDSGQGDDRRVKFSAPREKFQDWKGESGLRIGAFWGMDWHWRSDGIELYDASLDAFAANPWNGPYPMRPIDRYFVENALSELTAPGDFYVDRQKALIALRPRSEAPIEAPIVENLLLIKNAQNVLIEGLALEKAHGDAVKVEDSANIAFRDCFIGRAGGRGLVVSGGENVSLTRCVVAETGETGVEMKGGDRQILKPSGHAVEESIIADFGQDIRSGRPGVELDGVGQIIRRTLITRGPHNAIRYLGNDHLIEDNEISHVVRETVDAGAIETWRDWTGYGVKIVGNYIHDIRSFSDDREWNALGIYFDDHTGGALVKGNIFYNLERAIFLNSGRDTNIAGNFFCKIQNEPFWVTSREKPGWQNLLNEERGGLLFQRLNSVPYKSSPWKERYPRLSDLLSDRPFAPQYNVVQRNAYTTAKIAKLERGTECYVEFKDDNQRFKDSGSGVEGCFRSSSGSGLFTDVTSTVKDAFRSRLGGLTALQKERTHLKFFRP